MSELIWGAAAAYAGETDRYDGGTQRAYARLPLPPCRRCLRERCLFFTHCVAVSSCWKEFVHLFLLLFDAAVVVAQGLVLAFTVLLATHIVVPAECTAPPLTCGPPLGRVVAICCRTHTLRTGPSHYDADCLRSHIDDDMLPLMMRTETSLFSWSR